MSMKICENFITDLSLTRIIMRKWRYILAVFLAFQTIVAIDFLSSFIVNHRCSVESICVRPGEVKWR